MRPVFPSNLMRQLPGGRRALPFPGALAARYSIVSLLLLGALSAASGCDSPDSSPAGEDSSLAPDEQGAPEDGVGSPDSARQEDVVDDAAPADDTSVEPDEAEVEQAPTDIAVEDLQGPEVDVALEQDALSDVEAPEDTGADVAQIDDSLPEDIVPEDTIPASLPVSVNGLKVQVSPIGDQGIRVVFTTSEPAHGSLVVEDLSDSSSFEKDGAPGLNLDHTIQVLGLKPARAFKLTVTAKSEKGLATVATLTHKTGPPPPNMPPIAVTASLPALKDSGLVLAGLMAWTGMGTDPSMSMLAAIDSDGLIRWRVNMACLDFQRQANGRLLCVQGTKLIFEIDLFYGVVGKWAAEDMGLDSFHHSIYPLPNGNILALSTEVRPIEYPLPGGKTQVLNVVGDVVVEFHPDGYVISKWKMLDLLDPQYVPDPNGFEEPFWNLNYPFAQGGTKDWSHGNSLFYDPSDDSILVSLAKLDYVVKISRETGELQWRFGALGDFQLANGEWPSHQHAASLGENGLLRMFDNGALKDPPESRVVEYSLEPSTDGSSLGNAWQVWEFSDAQPFFSEQFGDAGTLPNGNILIADSSRLTNPELPAWDAQNGKFSRILEVTHTTPPQIVHEMVVPAPGEDAPAGYWITKVKRIELN